MLYGLSEGQINQNKLTKIRGGKVMKKMLKSKKGFSLIELLIVVAILAILAAISINLFGGVLNRQKDKSDLAAASYLQKAIQTYIAETADSDLSSLGGQAAGVEGIATALSGKTTIDTVDYGPYLNSDDIKLSKAGGYDIDVDIDNEVVTVVPAAAHSLAVN